MVNFGTICSWKIRSLHINGVEGGGGNFTTCKIYGRLNSKKKLGWSWGGPFENVLSFLKMAATTPPPVWKSSKLSQNGRNHPPPPSPQVINDVLYINCNILSFTLPIFENQILPGLTGKQFYKRMVFPEIHLPVAHNPTHPCYQNWKAYWQTEAGPVNTNQIRSYHWQIKRGREGAVPLWNSLGPILRCLSL